MPADNDQSQARDTVAQERPHECLIDRLRRDFDARKGDLFDALGALHALYWWYRERSARSPEAEGYEAADDGSEDSGGAQADPFGRAARTLIEKLGDRLHLQLLEQGASSGAFWGLTEEGKRLAIVAQQLLATLDQEIISIHEGRDRMLRRQPPIHFGCFNAQVKLYLAAALGRLRDNDAFGYDIRFNPDMNIRTVNARVILDDVGRDRGDRKRDRGLYRMKGFHYGVVPWVNCPNPHKDYPPPTYHHKVLYTWKLLVVAPETSDLRVRSSLTLGDVVKECERLGLPLLLTPPYNISRMMVDADFCQQSKVPLVPYILENPDSYTRYELARQGHGIAIVSADTLPPPPAKEKRPPYPYLLNVKGQLMSGFHTLTWKPLPARGGGAQRGASTRDPDADGPVDEDEVRLAKLPNERRPPSGMTVAAHRLLCTAIVEEVANFARLRQDVDLPA